MASQDSSTEAAAATGSGWFSGWFSWCPTSEQLLEAAESRILQHVKTHYLKKFVPLKNNERVWTISYNPSSRKIPLVMVHGFGGGLALWVMNIDTLAKNRAVHTFDLVGFGRSSRPEFSEVPEEAEEQFIDHMESWREELGVDKFVLLGHSLGGFLVSSYALKYPERVQHLILADPWGFPEKPSDDEIAVRIPPWVKVLGAVLSPFNPLAGLRAAGPWGPKLVRKFRPDFQKKYSSVVDDDSILNYIYHCNAQTPSGETAFRNMTIPYGWAKCPMISRIGEMREDVPITVVYGSRSWMDHTSGHSIKYLRPNSYVDIQVVKGAGHHVYADQPEAFNDIVEEVFDMVDKKNEGSADS